MYHAFVYSNIIPPHADHQGNPDCHSRHCWAHLCDGRPHNPRRTLPELPPRELPDIFFYNQSDSLWSILLFLAKYQGVVEISATSTTMMTIRMFGPLELKHTAWGNTFKLKIAQFEEKMQQIDQKIALKSRCKRGCPGNWLHSTSSASITMLLYLGIMAIMLLLISYDGDHNLADVVVHNYLCCGWYCCWHNAFNDAADVDGDEW